MIPTEDGVAAIHNIPDYLKSASMTAEWENDLLRMERGEIKPNDFMQGIHGLIDRMLADLRQIPTVAAACNYNTVSVGSCPVCGNPVHESKLSFCCADRSCKFALWKESRYLSNMRKTLDKKMAVDLLKKGRTHVKDFYSAKKDKTSVPESGREGRAADHREVRDAAQDVPEREPKELVSEYADERQAEPASGADRGSSGEPGGNPAGQPEREVSGTEQGEGPAGMGGAPEQPDGDGRRDRLEGIGVQLTEPTTEQDLSEAEEEIASAFSFPDLPTMEQQIRAIEAPIQARYADEIALDPEVVDEILRTGSNRSKHFLEKGDMSANEIYCRLDNEGISKRVARMVKTEMGIHCYQKKRRWYWSVQPEEGAVNGPQA